MAENQHLEGTVEHVLFRNEANGYLVLDLNANGELVTVTGELGEADEGEVLSLWGQYTTHPRYGQQFQAESCERKLPSTASDIERYLSSGTIKGIGKSLASKIVKAFGDKTLDIIEHQPERLMEIRGMSQSKCDEITKETKHIFALKSVISYFDGYGIKSRYAMRAFRLWGTKCRDTVEKNPYLLCQEAVGMDFRNVEAYAHDLRIPKEAYCRISAGIVHILQHNASNDGHTCLPLDRLAKTAVRFLEIRESLFYECYQRAILDDEIIEYQKEEREFVYLPEYFFAEQYITERISLLKRYSPPEQEMPDYSAMIADIERNSGMKYAELQKQAILSAMTEGMLILTGGPGTGKTTTLNAIISCFQKQDYEVLIAAPTGRAAKRISDLTGYQAKTIHRLLEVQFDASGLQKFVHNEENPLSCDVIIIDEMSMVDVLLFSSLLRALRADCKLILVGDSDQLPSVGAGNLLQHLLESRCMTTITLKEIFRQAQQSCIITNAHRIVNGQMPDLSRKDNDFFFFHRPDFQSAADLLIDLTCRRLPKAYSYSPTKDIQIICPSKIGILGTVQLNQALQARLNPPSADKPQVKSSVYEFRPGDKVMQTKNNYDITWIKDDENGKGIFNGDIGTILSVNRRQGEAVIDFDGRKTVYPLTMMEQLDLAYAITVHKSQGSEFEVVIIPMMGRLEKLTYRNLFYTAVTRAKKLLILIGTPQKVQQMVESVHRNFRYSCLKYMLGKELDSFASEHQEDS
ncbi:MAG: ATP-dependent RecD-like DNA helicase [Ruminococcus sp.]|nr:ATP-dependent RecD-like DNA helicase [Ruminococcus sp.]